MQPKPEKDGLIHSTPEIEKNIAEFEEIYERRLQFTPMEWRSPLIDVLDTYDMCAIRLMSLQGYVVPKDAIELTKLVLARKSLTDKLTAEELTDEGGA